MKRLLIRASLLLFLTTVSFTQERLNTFSLSTVPFTTLPMGNGSDYFDMGYGVEAEFSYSPAVMRGFGLGLNAEYFILPLITQNSIWISSIQAGPSYIIRLGKRISLFARGGAGYYYFDAMGWDSGGNNGGGLSYGGGAGGAVRLFGSFSMGLGASYDYYNHLYNGLSLALYGRFDFEPGSKERSLRDYSESQDVQIEEMNSNGKGVVLQDMELISLYPVLYKYYDSNPIGTVRVINNEDQTVTNVMIKFYMERYMDNPMEIGEGFTLEPGEETTLELFGLFTEDMMEITEGTKASAKISLSYSLGSETLKADYTQVMEVKDRNALVWDDDRKIASFITAKDPLILSFSKKVSNWMQEFENPAVDENLQKGMILFEAVKSYGVRYEVDPATPFANVSAESTFVDFIQFPRQTLEYTTGDCDDLTALYNSLLESVGVPTAFITIPGHIYMAFGLKSSPEESRKSFSRRDEFIYENGMTWVPLEITMFQDSFAEAWQKGAKQWRENESKGQARIYLTQSSWDQYQAVGFKEGAAGSIEMPSRSDVTTEFVNTISRFVDQEIYPQKAAILAKMEESNKKHIYLNKLGVLYARYGLYEEAEQSFEQVNSERVFLPTLLNMGNISFLKKDFKGALKWYEHVLSKDSDNKKALLGSARCNHEMENYGSVSTSYEELKSIDPVLAQKFAYLDLRGSEGRRAADARGNGDLVLWEDEE